MDANSPLAASKDALPMVVQPLSLADSVMVGG
jgi:hypothetical protein